MAKGKTEKPKGRPLTTRVPLSLVSDPAERERRFAELAAQEKAKKKPKAKPTPRTIRRSAITGKLVTKAQAKAKPAETVEETVERVLWRGWAALEDGGGMALGSISGDPQRSIRLVPNYCGMPPGAVPVRLVLDTARRGRRK